MLKLTFTVAMALLLTGCVAQPRPRLAEFREEEYLRYGSTGTGCIKGQAFLVTRSGDVQYAAGREIYLNPVTSYSTEHYQRHVLGGEPLQPADPRIQRYTRRAVGDGEGRFAFTNLPPGEYYVVAPIQWEYVSGYAYGSPISQITGGIAHCKCDVRDGQVLECVVTRR